MEFVPAPGCVLADPIDHDMVVASADKRRTRVAKVTAIGKNVSDINPGDLIFFDDYAHRTFEHDSKEYFLVDVSNDGLWGILTHGTDSSRSEMQA